MARKLTALALSLLVLAGASLAAEPAGEWVCPPCGHSCDDHVYDAPRTCPMCGMRLVTRSAARAEAATRVLILLYDGVQIIDFTGPYEVFGQARFAVATVSADGKPVTTAMGLRITPDHSFATSGQADLLLLPGGDPRAAYESAATVDWVKRQAQGAQHVLTVCNGAFILARAGLLDGMVATTFYRQLDELASFAPRVRVVRDQRFVDNGKTVTTAGLSSGIDGSLHVVEKILGRGRAQQIALHLEYQWDPQSGFARAALADRLIPDIAPLPGAVSRVLATAGDRERWETRYAVQGAASADAARQHLERELVAAGWTRTGGTGAAAWRFLDGDVPWQAETEVSSGKDAAEVLVRVSLQRASAASSR